jgi:hypothetical protein
VADDGLNTVNCPHGQGAGGEVIEISASLFVLYFVTRYMIFSREYVGYLARQTVKHLIDAKMIRTDKLAVVDERVQAGLLEELSLEDRINEEVRMILDAYQDEMRRTGAGYAEMFKKVKTELARKYKAVL